MTTYEPGSQLDQHCIESPNRPAFAAGYRESDTVYVNIAAWTDQANHPGIDAFVFEGESFDRFELTLSSDGEVHPPDHVVTPSHTTTVDSTRLYGLSPLLACQASVAVRC